jgi:hypothetical protein
VTDRSDYTGDKVAHELLVARALIVALRAAGEDIDDPRPRGAPDAVVSSPRGPIGIEVADAFYDDTGPPAAPAWGTPVPAGLAEGGSDAALAEHLNATLRDQCRKSYGMPTYFVLDVGAAPPSGAADGPAMAAALTIPEGCRFARIFLRMTPRAGGAPAVFEVPRPRVGGAT